MGRKALSLCALALCAVSLSGCQNGFCDETLNPVIQLLGGLLGCTSDDVFDETLPEARFTVSPSSPRVGETVTFDAVDSRVNGDTGDVAIGLVGFEWDTDGDNARDAGGVVVPTGVGNTAGAFARVTKVYAAPGPVTVRLRVTAFSGHTGTTERVVVVRPAGSGEPTGPGTSSPTAPGPGRLAAGTRTSTATVFGTLSGRPRDGRVVGRAKARFEVAGALPRPGAKPKVPKLVKTLLGGRWTLAMTSGSKSKVRGRALVTVSRGGPTACAKISISSTRVKGAVRGTLRLLGGTGAAGRLRLTIKFLADSPGFDARIAGTVRATTGAARRGLPRACLPAAP